MLVLFAVSSTASAQHPFRDKDQPVLPLDDTAILAEAEEFRIQSGWQAKPYGTNYFAATFALSFLSRQAYLGAPAQVDRADATIRVQVPKAGKYLTLVRYEATYRFENQFRVKVVQNGKVVLDRPYGSRDNLRIWAFGKKLTKEVAWDWGAVENSVWEGHDAFAELQPGLATITLVAGKQPEPAGRRNIDCVLLTSDAAEVEKRIAKENFLPLDGLLHQGGDVHLKVHTRADSSDFKLTVPPGTEHSPYWVHMRTWKPKVISGEPGKSTDWQEVGSLLDTLSHGQWNLTAAGKAPHFDLEFGIRNAAGDIVSVRKFPGLKGGRLPFVYDGDTRGSRRIRLAEEILYDLVADLKNQKVHGKPPQQTLIYGITFDAQPDNPKYTAALDEFIQLMGTTAMVRNTKDDVHPNGLIRGYIDVRAVPTPKLEAYCEALKAEGRADKIAVVSLGDEIGLATPNPKDPKVAEAFRTWLATQKVRPQDLGGDDKLAPDPSPAGKANPRLYYYSKLFGFHFGLQNLKDRTNILKKYLPSAGIGANYSPHHKHLYLGDTHHWISVFREGAMTMPWGEDYIWQVPVGSQQMNFIMPTMYRAGLKNHPTGKIHYYVMPHTPGNTVASWRRQFFGDLAHGVKVLNLFEFRPVQFAYTENHTSDPAMYKEIRKSLHELGTFEDIIQSGKLAPAPVGIWCSETADVWDDHRHPFDAAKRCLFIALRHQQLPVDFIVDGDDLKHLKVLHVCDAHVSRAGAKRIADWVKTGGTLVLSAGAGAFDEFNQPLDTLAELAGIKFTGLDEAAEPIRFEKQDLPFAKPVGKVENMPVFGVRSKFGAEGATAKFDDGTAAIAKRSHGGGQVVYLGFLPGLSYFHPAMPKIPVDRGSTDDASAHLIPENFDESILKLLPTDGVERPVICSAPRVEAMVLQSPKGIVVPLVNWNRKPIEKLEVEVRVSGVGQTATLASGRAVTRVGNKYVLDLDVADALILR